jgi:hypothetical protein
LCSKIAKELVITDIRVEDTSEGSWNLPLRPGAYEVTVQILQLGERLKESAGELQFGTDERMRDIGG